jgi:hypothetical protein
MVGWSDYGRSYAPPPPGNRVCVPLGSSVAYPVLQQDYFASVADCTKLLIKSTKWQKVYLSLERGTHIMSRLIKYTRHGNLYLWHQKAIEELVREWLAKFSRTWLWFQICKVSDCMVAHR